MAAGPGDPDYDPIIKDIMKLNPPPPLPTDEELSVADEYPVEASIVEYSLQLAEVLDFLLNQRLDDSTRIECETRLTELTSSVPVLLADKDAQVYPNDHLSQILIDNYLLLLQLVSLYFNMSLSSHVTKYLVKVIYKLECWEIYHLLQIIPDIEYFLKLVDIEVTHTPFGHIVRPPENLMNFNMRQGFQYPFPYPFYNFSYHTPDPYATARKYARVHIDDYIDIRLKRPSKRRKRPRSWPKLPKYQDETVDMRRPSRPEGMLHSPPVLRSQGSGKFASELDYQKHQKVFIFMEMNSADIQQEEELLNAEDEDEDENENEDEDEDDEEYDTDEANEIMAEENDAVDMTKRDTDGFVIVPSVFERVLHDAERKGIAKLTTLHQCRLVDPGTLRPCLKIFYGKNELQRHQEFVHATTKKVYRCAYCESTGNRHQTYPRHDSLARHIRRKHGVTGRENKMAVTLAKQHAEVVDVSAGQHADDMDAELVISDPGAEEEEDDDDDDDDMDDEDLDDDDYEMEPERSRTSGRRKASSGNGKGEATAKAAAPAKTSEPAGAGVSQYLPRASGAVGAVASGPASSPQARTYLSTASAEIPSVPSSIVAASSGSIPSSGAIGAPQATGNTATASRRGVPPSTGTGVGGSPGASGSPGVGVVPSVVVPGRQSSSHTSSTGYLATSPQIAASEGKHLRTSSTASSTGPIPILASSRGSALYAQQPPVGYRYYDRDTRQVRGAETYVYPDYRREGHIPELGQMQGSSLIQGSSLMQGTSLMHRTTLRHSTSQGSATSPSMHGRSPPMPNTAYQVPQYPKYTPWLPSQPRDKSEESRGFQKFRFPSNYYPMGFQAYGPRYAQEVYYPVQVPGQAPYVMVSSQPPQSLGDRARHSHLSQQAPIRQQQNPQQAQIRQIPQQSTHSQSVRSQHPSQHLSHPLGHPLAHQLSPQLSQQSQQDRRGRRIPEMQNQQNPGQSQNQSQSQMRTRNQIQSQSHHYNHQSQPRTD